MNILEINLLLIIIYATIFLGFFKSNFSKKLFVWIVTIQLIIINGLRSITVGTDTIRYVRIFRRVGQTSSFEEFFSDDTELGYRIIQKLLYFFTDNFTIVLLIISIFIFCLLGMFIRKYSKDYFLSYLLFIGLSYYDFSFTGIRQSIAMVIVLFTYKYIINKDFLKFIILTSIAFLFHTSAIIILPVYFFANLNLKKYHILIVALSYYVFYLFRFKLGELLTLLYYDESNGSTILGRYNSTGSIGGLALLILAIIIIGFIIYNPFKNDDKENKVLFNIMLISFFVQSLSSFSYLFTRLNMYYLLFVIIYFPHILDNFDKMPVKLKKKEITLIVFTIKLLVTIVLILYYFNYIEIDGSNILPYNFFWNNKI